MMRFVGMPANAPAGTAPSPIGYRLEPGHNGGNNPKASHCGSPSYGDRVFTADCVGFVLWSLGIDRLQPGYKGSSGEWLHCPSIVNDADRDQRYFYPLDHAGAIPGDVLVNRSHIAIIVRSDVAGEHLVVDCSPRHGRKTAIGTGLPWADDCRVVRYKLLAS